MSAARSARISRPSGGDSIKNTPSCSSRAATPTAASAIRTTLPEENVSDGTVIHKYDGRCSRLSEEEIAANLAAGKPYVIRQKIPREGKTTFHDEIFGDITVDNDTLDDQVLIKRDGLPTYNFANVIDDHLMGITHVVRGSEYLSSTPKYNLLYEGFGWEIPKYIHCSPVMRDQHNKMSKAPRRPVV